MENVNILIVDENREDRKRLIDKMACLNHYTYQITEAETLENAFEYLESSKIGLMFLNFSCGDNDRIATFRKLEENYPKIAKIIVTNNSNETLMNDLLKEGVQDFLIKNNFTSSELFKTVNYAFERNKTRMALVESKTFFQSTIDSLSDSVAILDEKGFIIYVNRAWQLFSEENNFNGSNHGLGLNYIENSLSSNDKEKVGENVAACIIELIEGRRDTYSIEYSCHSQNEERWFVLNLSSFEQNNKKRIVARHENITKRKEDEETIRTSDKIFQHSIDMLCIAGFDGYFKVLNPSWERTLGWSKEELLSKPWIEFVHPDDREKTEAIKEEIIGGRTVYQFYNRYISKDGTEKILAWTTFPYSEEQIMFGVARDVTEELQRKDRLETINLAIDQLPVSVVVTDVEGNIKFVNPKFTQVSGYSSDEVIGKKARIFKSGTMPTSFYEKLWKTLLSGKEWTGEFHNKKKNGQFFWEYAKISPVKNEKGETTSFISIKEDISRRKKIEAELILSKKEAEKSDRLKSEFLTQISHEIRTPVNTLLSFSSLIENELQESLSDDLLDSFKYMRKAGDRIIRTIDLIIKVSELQTENYETDFRENNLIELLDTLIEEYKLSAENKNLKLKFFQMVDSAKLVFDKHTMRDVFSNLIDNAIKYTNEGEVKVYLKKTIMNKLSVEVIDTGIGISQKYYEDIFKPFSQETSGYTRIFDGNGLGLTLVKKYCDVNNAEVFINSQKGLGSTFTIIFK